MDGWMVGCFGFGLKFFGYFFEFLIISTVDFEIYFNEIFNLNISTVFL
jgi:hypothetical protein